MPFEGVVDPRWRHMAQPRDQLACRRGRTLPPALLHASREGAVNGEGAVALLGALLTRDPDRTEAVVRRNVLSTAPDLVHACARRTRRVSDGRVSALACRGSQLAFRSG